MTHKVDLHANLDGEPLATTLRAVLQFQGRTAAEATALTDSSTGSAGTLAAASVAQANVADSGTSLAQKASTETALGTVVDAVATLFAKANTAATALGLDTITDNSGGTSGGDTLAAMTQSVTAAATGVQATEVNAIFAALNQAFNVLAGHVNKLAAATGAPVLDLGTLGGSDFVGTIPAVSTDGGTAADPGVTKAAVDTALAVYADNAATIAVTLNAAIAGPGTPGAVAV